MIIAGVDIGSTTSKAVLLKGDNILGQVLIKNRSLPTESAIEAFERFFIETGINKEDIKAIATTGYARPIVALGAAISARNKSEKII